MESQSDVNTLESDLTMLSKIDNVQTLWVAVVFHGLYPIEIL